MLTAAGLGRICFKAQRAQRRQSRVCLTQPGQAGCGGDLSCLLEKDTRARDARRGPGYLWPQLGRGNALTGFVIKVLQGNTEMREEEPFCSRGFIYGCPKLPGAAGLNATTSREEAAKRAVRPGVIQLLLLLNSKQRARSMESSFTPAADPAAAVPSAGSGRRDSARQQQGGSRGCPTSWGRRGDCCWWDSAGDLHPSPSPQLSVDRGRDSGPQHNRHTYLLWEESRGRKREHKQ